MELETLTKNQEEYKKQDLKNLVYEWLEHNINSNCTKFRSTEEQREASKKAKDIFYVILNNKKNEILQKLEGNEKEQFISLLNKKRDVYHGLTDSEEQVIISVLDKETLYPFFLGYGFLTVGAAFTKRIFRWEKIFEIAEKNGDIVQPGKSERVVKIKIPQDKKTIIFKKADKKSIDELNLENSIWMYYYFRLCTLTSESSVTYDKEQKQKYFFSFNEEQKQKYRFNLPEKIMFYQGVLKEDLAYLIWRVDSEDLLSTALNSDEGKKKELIKQYLKEVAKLDAFGPHNLIPPQAYLITKEDFVERMRSAVSKKAEQSLTEKILANYEIIADSLSRSKVKGIIKDATLKNATYYDSKVTCIDFNRLRVAPLQMDLSKTLILSYNDRRELLTEFIKEYNDAAEFFNKNFSNKALFFPNFKKCKVEPERQKIDDLDEFYFVYLNFVVDYALFFLLGDEHKSSFGKLDINNTQKHNALSALEELKTAYKKMYCPQGLKKLDYLSEMFKTDIHDLV
ncbi:MAG: hypothetical protein Q8O03_01445 [Nanoarchaeota archaeon]|nr:hypothetical protein [Nanoarchaeota archaeon]